MADKANYHLTEKGIDWYYHIISIQDMWVIMLLFQEGRI